MSRDDETNINTWEEIEDAIARKVEMRLAAEMIDVDLAAVRAREFAADAVCTICSILGGDAHYVPKIPHHHREARNVQIRINFNGIVREVAADVGLTPRHIRNIVNKRRLK